MTEQLGRVLGGRYRLIAPIGTGASAQVFLADDVKLRRRVAIKVLHPALADDQAFLRRFRAEARAAAALSHPNLMAVYDWTDEGDPYLVLEYLGGGSLRALLDRGRRLAVNQAVLEGLEAARAQHGASLDAPIDQGDEARSLGDRFGISDTGFERAEERVLAEQLSRGLSARDREILRLRFEEDLTQAEIGMLLGVSQMQVSRLIRSALERLRAVAAHDEVIALV